MMVLKARSGQSTRTPPSVRRLRTVHRVPTGLCSFVGRCSAIIKTLLAEIKWFDKRYGVQVGGPTCNSAARTAELPDPGSSTADVRPISGITDIRPHMCGRTRLLGLFYRTDLPGA